MAGAAAAPAARDGQGSTRAAWLAAAGSEGGEAVEAIVSLLLDAASDTLEHLHGKKLAAARLCLLLAGVSASAQSRPISLSKALDACSITLDCAVRELSPAAAALEPAVSRVLGNALPLERRLQLRELKQGFVFNTLLAKKTWDLHAAYFSPPPDAHPASPLGLLWLLCCTARAALLPLHADLVTSFGLLLACAHLLLRQAPPWLLAAGAQLPTDPDELLAAVAARNGAAEHLPAIRQLAGLLQALLAQVLEPAAETQAAAAQHGVQQHQAPHSSSTGGGGPMPAAPAWRSFPDLFGADGLAPGAVVDALQQRYRQLAASADIDALPFLGLHPPAAAQPNVGSPSAAQAQRLPNGTHPAGGSAGATDGAAQAAAPEPAQMDVDAAAAPAGREAQGAAPAAVAVAAGGGEEPESPHGRQATHAVATTPQRRSRVAHVDPAVHSAGAAPEWPAAGPAAEGGGEGAPLPAAAYHTPSPARQRQRPPPAPQPTPISAAMSSAAWLQAAVVGQPEGPSEQLRTLLAAAGLGGDAEARLAAAALQLAAAAFPDCTAPLKGPLLALEQSTTAARRSQGLRLYWRVLQGLVGAECARPDAGPAAAATLLSSLLFQRCVAACAFECVICSYRMANLAFPAVLERLRLPAFDMCKAVEPDLKRHMLSVEEQCLESLAWQQGSSLYPALIAAVGPHGGSAASGVSKQAAAAGPNAQQQQQQSSSPASSHSVGDGGSATDGAAAAGAGGLTPRKRGLEAAASGGVDPAAAQPPAQRRHLAPDIASGEELGASRGSSTPSRTASGGRLQPRQAVGPDAQPRLPLCLGPDPLLPGQGQEGPREGREGGQPLGTTPRGDPASRAAIGEFLRRVLKLAAIRLADLLGRLEVQPGEPAAVLAEAYTLARHVAFEHTWLLYCRHLDQTMLCCLYSVCKLRQLQHVTFKAIVAAYKQQPQARDDIFNSVSMHTREATGLSDLRPATSSNIIAFYNELFIPHAKPFLLRLEKDPTLVVQPPASVLPHLSPQPAHGMLPGIPPPPRLHPASQQSPCPPLLSAASQPASPLPWGLMGTPSRGAAAVNGVSSAGNMLLLSPGAWRITRDQMAALRVAGSPLLPTALRSHPSTPLSAMHHMFGLTSGAGMPQLTLPSPPRLTPVLSPLRRGPGPVQPLVSDAEVRAMFASAEAAAAAGPMQVDAAQRQQAQQQQGRPGTPPAESLPLLAAAAEAAAEMEQREGDTAAAGSSLRPSDTPPVPDSAGAPAVLPSASPVLAGPSSLHPAPLHSPRHARRILSLQPSAVQ